MSTHFSSAFLIDDIRLQSFLGIYDSEHLARQPVSISLRLYFPSPPAWVFDDHVTFFDYQVLVNKITEMVENRSFRLIEYMAQEAMRIVREHLDSIDAGHFRIWLKLTKVTPPIEQLKGGASFVITDLPIGSAIVDVV